MAKPKQYRFRVTLCGRKGESDFQVVFAGHAMLVNHRGDLGIVDKVPTTYLPDAPCVCCFKTGSWLYAERLEEVE